MSCNNTRYKKNFQRTFFDIAQKITEEVGVLSKIENNRDVNKIFNKFPELP